MNLAVTIKKIKRNLNDFGIREAFEKGILYLLKGVYQNRTYRIYRRDLRAEQFPETSPEGLVFKVVGSGDIQAMKQIEDMEEWLQGMLPEIMKRGLCIAAFDGPRVVGFNLVAFQEVYVSLLNLKKRLRPHQAWSEQITVLKTYRKHGLASALRYRVFAELKKRGIRTFYGGALVSNIPSLRNAEKVGFRFIADVQYLKILKRERRMYRRIKHVAH